MEHRSPIPQLRTKNGFPVFQPKITKGADTRLPRLGDLSSIAPSHPPTPNAPATAARKPSFQRVTSRCLIQCPIITPMSVIVPVMCVVRINNPQ